MLNKKVSDLLNEQINKELYSGYLYLDMNNYFDKRGLAGFANWYMIQAMEERDHAMLIYKYMQNNDCPIVLNAIAKPDKKFKKDMDVLKAGLEHEEYVTASIHAIYDAAYKVKDFRTMQFLDWFVKEQGEEETNARDMITKMELFGSDPKSLYMLNQELAARTYSAPSLVLDAREMPHLRQTHAGSERGHQDLGRRAHRRRGQGCPRRYQDGPPRQLRR